MIKYPYIYTCYAVEGEAFAERDKIVPIGTVYVRSFSFEEALKLAEDCLESHRYGNPFITTIRRVPQFNAGAPIVFKNNNQRVVFKPYTIYGGEAYA